MGEAGMFSNSEGNGAEFESVLKYIALLKKSNGRASEHLEHYRTTDALWENSPESCSRANSSPQQDVNTGEFDLGGILDIPAIQSLIDDFQHVAGIPIGLLDIQGNVLVAAGWQDICSAFHRAHPDTAANCLRSDLHLCRSVKQGEFVSYKCRNNMWDVVTPLYVGDRHVGNIFTGQFFYDDDDIDTALFLAQADRYGFDRDAYMAALARVPRFSRDRADAIMRFLARFTEHVSRQAYDALRLSQALREQKRVEAKLRASRDKLAASEKKLTLAMDMAGLAPWEYDYTAGLFTFNDRLFALHGTSCEQEGGGCMTPETYAREFLPPEEVTAFLNGIESLGTPGGLDNPPAREYPFIRRDGERRIKLVRYAVIRDASGRAVNLIGATQDITERRQADTTLHKTSGMLRGILECMPSAIIVLDARGRVTHWNSGATALCGPDAATALGMPLGDICPVLARLLADGTRVTSEDVEFLLEKQPVILGGEPRYLDVQTYPLTENGVVEKVLRVDDVTHKAQLEEMMVQHAKMLSVGNLAGGMAHEINNPLAGILYSVQNIQRRISTCLPANIRAAEEAGCGIDAVRTYLERRQVVEFLDSIRQAGERAAGIVKNMLGFIRKTSSERVPTPLAAVVDRAVEIAATDYDLKKQFDFRRIAIIREYQPGMPLVPCTPSEIEQVIFNILGNAAHAMARNTRQDSPPRVTLRVRLDGDAAVIEVEDNGPGMDETARRKIFEPFYSTKQPGEGTGLGLAVSYFIIVSSHKGRLSVESGPDLGAKFVIRLPLGLPEQS